MDLAAEIFHIKEPQKIPLVMSPDEAKRLLAMSGTLKVRVLLALGYGAGLRAGEVVRLRVGDIDSAQNIIRIVQAKGRKDRHVMLSPETLDLLRQWWKVRSRRFHLWGSVNACTPLPLPSKELPEVTNSIFPTGVAAEFIDPGISKVLSKSPV